MQAAQMVHQAGNGGNPCAQIIHSDQFGRSLEPMPAGIADAPPGERQIRPQQMLMIAGDLRLKQRCSLVCPPEPQQMPRAQRQGRWRITGAGSGEQPFGLGAVAGFAGDMGRGEGEPWVGELRTGSVSVRRGAGGFVRFETCLLYTSPSPRD